MTSVPCCSFSTSLRPSLHRWIPNLNSSWRSASSFEWSSYRTVVHCSCAWVSLLRGLPMTRRPTDSTDSRPRTSATRTGSALLTPALNLALVYADHVQVVVPAAPPAPPRLPELSELVNDVIGGGMPLFNQLMLQMRTLIDAREHLQQLLHPFLDPAPSTPEVVFRHVLGDVVTVLDMTASAIRRQPALFENAVILGKYPYFTGLRDFAQAPRNAASPLWQLCREVFTASRTNGVETLELPERPDLEPSLWNVWNAMKHSTVCVLIPPIPAHSHHRFSDRFNNNVQPAPLMAAFFNAAVRWFQACALRLHTAPVSELMAPFCRVQLFHIMFVDGEFLVGKRRGCAFFCLMCVEFHRPTHFNFRRVLNPEEKRRTQREEKEKRAGK